MMRRKLYGVSAIGPVLTGNTGTPRACRPHAERHERLGDCSYAILHVIMSQWFVSIEVTSRHGYLSSALGGGDTHVGPGLGSNAVGPPAGQQHHAHLLHAGSVPTLYPSGAPALAVAGGATPGGVMGDGGSDGTAVRRLVFAL